MAGLITALFLVPLLATLCVSVAPKNYARGIALGCNAITAIVALTAWRSFDSGAAGLQMIERHVWIPAIGSE
jgi:NADH:ubiquinone oxidoreductase subunit 4 (subunit M)